jgi:hypothetical protein
MNSFRIFLYGIISGLLATILASAMAFSQEANNYFGIQVVDQQTGRGIPMVRLRTTNSVDYWTDSNGWVAFLEPGSMFAKIYFSIESAGYEYPADGFGFRGVALTPIPGSTATVRLKRTNLAERLYRVTGQGIYRDSQLLGQPYPADFNPVNAGVTGQDSVQMVPFRDQLFWLWGDTNVQYYPLGNFRTTAALSPQGGDEGTDPDKTISLKYLTSSDGRVRKMLPTDQPGAVWLFGLINVPNEAGDESLIAHYSRHLSLGQMVEHGITIWNETLGQFEIKATFDLDNRWRIPRGQALRVNSQAGDFVYFAEPFATTRVPANQAAMLEPDSYEAYAWDQDSGKYTWQKQHDPITPEAESKLLADRVIRESQANYQLMDVETQKPVRIHRASINWNEFRQKWIMIGCEMGGRESPSLLGEIWYAEAPSITGPWRQAVKIASHPRYTFYNPRQHAALDKGNGRFIYFEGTYTHQFSGNDHQTPRYDYNQIMYRLDLTSLPQKVSE